MGESMRSRPCRKRRVWIVEERRSGWMIFVCECVDTRPNDNNIKMQNSNSENGVKSEKEEEMRVRGGE